VITRREQIISAVNNRYLKRTHKFGIAVPKTVQDATQLDLANGNTLLDGHSCTGNCVSGNCIQAVA
jgi:uncharacterized membrane protein